jgi:hypothetical protein
MSSVNRRRHVALRLVAHRSQLCHMSTLADFRQLRSRDGDDLRSACANGGNGMRSFGTWLDANEIQAAVDYIYTTFSRHK